MSGSVYTLGYSQSELGEQKGNGAIFMPSLHVFSRRICPCGKCTIPSAALCWFQFGFFVIPLWPGSKKTAVTWDWVDDLSEGKIIQYWTEHPDHEIGFIVGDDLLVLDADTPEAVKTLDTIEESFGIKSSLVVKTCKGEHRYYRLAADVFAKTSGHGNNPGQEIDIKTGRTMVALPPSGGKYILRMGGKDDV